MGGGPCLTIVALAGLALGPAPGLVADPPEVRLRGPDDRVQVVISGADGTDLTRGAGLAYECLDPAVARVDGGGVVRPVGDGETRLAVRAGGGGSLAVRVVVVATADRRAVGFVNEVVPILTRLGCDAGACHGKAGGQNGFRLSLLGSDPGLDFESLVRDGRGRRVFPAAPRSSLILRKPTAALPHGGGRRLDVGSPEYRTLERWIGQGTPFDPEGGGAPTLTGLEVRPGARVIGRGGTQQLRAVARYSDGSEADVTRLARFQSNAADLADVDERGQVTVRGAGAVAAVMARFGGRVAVARITVPLGAAVPAWEPPPSENLIDGFVFAGLKTLGIPPSRPCDDAAFARRASLDVCGVLPTPAEVAALEADPAPEDEARARWVDRLLARPEYADRFALTWSAVLRNKRTLGRLSQPGTFALDAWVREALAENLPYDRFAAAILTARGDAAVNPPVVWFRQVSTVEDQADDTAQLFLGLRLQCARCHHHPYERWGQDDYYGFASLFARVGRKAGPDPVTPRIFNLPEGRATDPAGRAHPPRLLGAADPLPDDPGRDPREDLVGWLRRPDNPYFARAVVNRYWKHFFGRGLVEPEDDLRASNPPTHPELLDALSADFVAHGYDLKRLVRTLATSRAYGRSSAPNAWNLSDRQAYSRFAPRRLPAELLLDAVDTVTGARESYPGLPDGLRAAQLPDEGFDTPGRFLAVFGRPKRESVCECERSAEPSLTQSLHLMNSPEIERKISAPAGRAARWAADDTTPDAAKVAALYRVALSRFPTSAERDACLEHLARRRGEGRWKDGYEDLVWSILNTKEFAFVE